MRFYAVEVGPALVIMDDNARTDRPVIIDDDLESVSGVTGVNARTLVLSIFAFGRTECTHPATLTELQTALQEPKRLLDSPMGDNLMESTVTRCKLCIQINGVHISYPCPSPD